MVATALCWVRQGPQLFVLHMVCEGSADRLVLFCHKQLVLTKSPVTTPTRREPVNRRGVFWRLSDLVDSTRPGG